ncbi:MAG: Uma2 family endonuclease [Snowella sp.]|nr:Uma2 family endonuclease [Snowella sp.]
MNTRLVNLPETLTITQEQFKKIAAANRDLRLEKNAQGQLIIMPPTGGSTGKRNFYLAGQLFVWNERSQLGVAFDSSTAFHLPNGANRSPDLAWIRKERWEQLTPDQQDDFAPICPDFILKLRSKTDSLPPLREKMQEYLENGVQLGWLIDPKGKTVEIYRVNQSVEMLQNPLNLSGENVLPNFVMDLQKVFD